ncbi:MAG: cell wall-binding repeat-containing protein [Actinobacteria bacterium]|nr:cell wall-binding repeat-containing protein [Actinomycetota bacterium]
MAIILLLVVLGAATQPTPTALAHDPHRRALPAADNIDAAIEVIRLGFAAGTAREVLLGRNDLFGDSLAAGSATGRPIVLTRRDVLDRRTAAELERLGAEQVTILGGTDAIGAPVEAELIARGYAVRRIGGATRIQTAVGVARHYHPDAAGVPVVIARAAGDGTQAFADAVGGSALAHHLAAPVVLTPSQDLHDDVAAYLVDTGAREVIVAGGTAAVSAGVEHELRALGITVRRAAGRTRTGTAVEQDQRRGFAVAADARSVLLIDGYDPDAWVSGFAAGAWAASQKVAIVLADGADLDRDTSDFLADAPDTDLVCAAHVVVSACVAAERAMHLPAFATTGGVVLRLPSPAVDVIGFHESNHDGARQLEVVSTGAPTVTLPSRGRGTGSRSAADVVSHPDLAVRAPVTGRVLRAGPTCCTAAITTTSR